MRNLLGQQDLWSAYARYQQDETVPSNFLVENIVEMTLIFEVDYQKKIGNSGSNKSDKDASQRASVLVPVMTTGANRLGSCTQMDVYGNRLDIIGSSVNIDDLKSGRVTAVTISMTVVTDEGMALVDQIRQKKRPAPSLREIFRTLYPVFHPEDCIADEPLGLYPGNRGGRNRPLLLFCLERSCR